MQWDYLEHQYAGLVRSQGRQRRRPQGSGVGQQVARPQVVSGPQPGSGSGGALGDKDAEAEGDTQRRENADAEAEADAEADASSAAVTAGSVLRVADTYVQVAQP